MQSDNASHAILLIGRQSNAALSMWISLHSGFVPRWDTQALQGKVYTVSFRSKAVQILAYAKANGSDLTEKQLAAHARLATVLQHYINDPEVQDSSMRMGHKIERTSSSHLLSAKTHQL